MSQELEKKQDEGQQALIETVRKTIFPDSTNSELALFFHKCTVAGVNPLDQLIHPTKFKQKDGTFKVTFITSINLLRSKSNEAGDYNGMDEPEFEGDSTYEFEGSTYSAPDLARVKVYRKGIERPFTGVARWKEYYPGDLKGHMWRKMPHNQLAKCAEALARRLAWPEKLNQLYTEEEMMQATEQLAGLTKPSSTKPAVSPDDVKPSAPETTGQNLPVGTITGVFQKAGEKNGKKWVKYSVTINQESYSTFDVKLAESAKSLKNQQVVYEFEESGGYKNLKSVKKYESPVQEPTPKPPKQPETAQESTQGGGGHTPPVVESSEAFASTLMLFCTQKGLDEAKLNGILEAEFQCSIDTVPAGLQEKVLEHLKSL